MCSAVNEANVVDRLARVVAIVRVRSFHNVKAQCAFTGLGDEPVRRTLFEKNTVESKYLYRLLVQFI